MRPNTPHAVLTPDAAICHGGHYLSTSTLRSTCYGFLMSFSLSTLLTNTNHTTECQLLFRKLLAYYSEVYTQGQPDDAGNEVIFTVCQYEVVDLLLKGHLNPLFPKHQMSPSSMGYRIFSRYVILSRWQTSSIRTATPREDCACLLDKT